MGLIGGVGPFAAVHDPGHGAVKRSTNPRVPAVRPSAPGRDAVEIEVKYAGYTKRQMELINQAKRMEDLLLPPGLQYSFVRGLSKEEVEKLTQIKPRTLGQAQRISGVNPSAVQAIMIYLKGHRVSEEQPVGSK